MSDIKQELKIFGDELKMYIDKKLEIKSIIDDTTKMTTPYNPVTGRAILILLVLMITLPFLVYHFF
jgi:hypothetical protein